MSKVLVIMASYNGEKFVSEQVDSILAQDHPDLTLHIIDDCSHDSTFALLKKYKDLPNVTVVQNKENVKLPGINFLTTLNRYYHLYDFIAFADQDDYWEKNKISTAIEKLADTDSDLYCSELNLWNGKEIYGTTYKKSKIRKFDHLFESASAGCTLVLTRKLAAEIKGITGSPDFTFWPKFSHDWFTYFVARKNHFKVYFDSDSFIRYRIHANNNFGVLDLANPKTLLFRLKLLFGGWYRLHLGNMIKYVDHHSAEFNVMDKLLNGGLFSRLKVVMKYGNEFRRNFSQRIVLAFAIIIDRF